MKILAAESDRPETRLLVFADSGGQPSRWLQLDGEGVVARGESVEDVPASASPTLLCVPGDQLSIHWRALPEGLTSAQAAAAARLLLADAAAEPMANLHVAVGQPEQGLSPIALVRAQSMEAWIAAAAGCGLDPDAILPSPMLLTCPEEGFVRRDGADAADYRAIARAFTLEPELAALLVGDARIATVGEAEFEAALPPLLRAPPLDLRQGRFAGTRQRRFGNRRLRRIGLLALALGALTLAVQVATILGYTFEADRLEAQAVDLAATVPPGGPGFGATAMILFDAIGATPNVEIRGLDFRADGSLSASILLDDRASLAALRGRLEAAGLRVESSEARNAGGRSAAEIVMSAA